jgi:hypothetical protein
MAITQLNDPIPIVGGRAQNIFPSQRPLNVAFERRDALITTIVSGTDNKVRMTLDDDYDSNLEVGDFVTWRTDFYPLMSVRVVALISSDTIEVDFTFISTVATNGWINYRKKWFLEARFVAPNTTLDAQNAILVLDDFSQVPSARDGLLNLDLSIVGDLLNPEFTYATGLQGNLFTMFKVQIRESYETQRTLPWESFTQDLPIMLVLASKDVVINDFTDKGIQMGKFYAGYPLVFSYVYSIVNDNAVNQVEFVLEQYDIGKVNISSSTITTQINLNGVFTIVVPPTSILENAAFVGMRAVVGNSSAQFDPTQFDPTQFA